jgi:intracellular septation protein
MSVLPAKPRPLPPLLKLVVEIGPIVVFFLANATWGIFVATGVYMVAAFAAFAVSWGLSRRVPVMPLIAGAFVLAFGGLTLVLHNDSFIKMKVTILNTLFGAILLSGLAFNHSLLRPIFGESFALTPQGWRILTFRWGLFLIALGAANEIVWRNVSTDTWVNFKVFVVMPLTAAFAVAQMGVLKKHMPLDAEREPAE